MQPCGSSNLAATWQGIPPFMAWLCVVILNWLYPRMGSSPDHDGRPEQDTRGKDLTHDHHAAFGPAVCEGSSDGTEKDHGDSLGRDDQTDRAVVARNLEGHDALDDHGHEEGQEREDRPEPEDPEVAHSECHKRAGSGISHGADDTGDWSPLSFLPGAGARLNHPIE